MHRVFKLGLHAMLLAGSFSAGGCRPSASFRCTAQAQCGEGGTCEPDGYCSFADDDCDSRRRYARFADPDLADICVPLPSAEGGSTDDDSGTSTAGSMGSGESSDDDTPPLEGTTGQDSGGLDGVSATTMAPTSEGTTSMTGSTSTATAGSTEGSSSSSESSESTGTDPDPLPELPTVTVSECVTNNLSDNVIDGYWQFPALPPGTNLFEQAGQVVFTLAANPAFVVLANNQPGSQTLLRVTVEIVQVPASTANNSQVLFGVGDGVDRVSFEISGGTIAARSDLRNGGGGVTIERVGARPYDPVEHRHLQLMFLAGEVWWSTSSDGTTFETFVEPISQPGYLFEADNRTEISAGTIGFQPTPPGPGQLRLERFEDCDTVRL